MSNAPVKRAEEGNDKPQEKRLTPYEKLSYDLAHDARAMKEITLGKRIGFYRIRGELGSGNFSQVKMGIHMLTKGNYLLFYPFVMFLCSLCSSLAFFLFSLQNGIALWHFVASLHL